MERENTKGRRRAPFLLAALAMAGPSAAADAPRFALPLDCDLGETCYIQQYVDRDPGPGTLDYGCRTQVNDGHKGTDFALPSLADMTRGVPVRAAAAGTVRGVRDGMPDIDVTAPNAPNVDGRECGNGVVLDHGDGWETQYCHLRQGSVSVRQGQQVDEGAPLGLVGMSGQATFPHVHFGIRHEDRVVDPFLPTATAACGQQADETLWQDQIAYFPGGILSAGLLDRVPAFAEIKAGLPEDALPKAPGALVLWAYVYAGQAGDILEMSIDGPAGTLGPERITLEKTQPFLFRAWGKRAPAGGFAQGTYSGTIRHLRNTVEIGNQQVRALLR